MSSVRSAGKMKLLCLVYWIFFSIVLLKAENSSLIVKVSVYYETLCPDSINFVRNQLDPNYNAFGKEYVQLELIPYGFAKEKHVNGKTIFTCQHGADECYGNKVHGCVFHLESIDKSEAFLTCSEKAPLPASTTTLKNCAKENGIVWSTVEKCLSSEQANEIMIENGRKTRNLGPKWIPTIVFNDKFDTEESKQAEHDLKGVICRYLSNKPNQCKNGDVISVVII